MNSVTDHDQSPLAAIDGASVWLNLDIDASGSGVVAAPRMYQLVRLRQPARRQTFEITFHDPGVRAYVFTSG